MRSCSASRARYLACSLLNDVCRAGEGGEAGEDEKNHCREAEGEQKEKEEEEDPKEGEEEVEEAVGRAAGDPVGMGTTEGEKKEEAL